MTKTSSSSLRRTFYGLVFIPVIFFSLWTASCGSKPSSRKVAKPGGQSEAPVSVELGKDMAPYVQEVFADSPLAHWRLNGDIPGAIEGDPDNGRRFAKGGSLELLDAEFGGDQFAVELWLKEASGVVLSYFAPASASPVGNWTPDAPALVLTAGDTISLEILGVHVETQARLDPSRWQHVGVSWRASDEIVLLAIDGQPRWLSTFRKNLFEHKAQLPFGGTLVLGGDFKGSIDEVAVFDELKYPAHWLDRWRVARNLSDASLPSEMRPVHPVIRQGTLLNGCHMVWSPDGKWIATTEKPADTVEIWETRKRLLVHRLRMASSSKYMQCEHSPIFSPDARRLAIVEGDHTVSVWSMENPGPADQLKCETKLGVKPARWSLDGSRFFAGNCVWDVATGRLLHNFETQDDELGSSSPDGERFATSHRDKSSGAWTVSVRETLTGKTAYTIADRTNSGPRQWTEHPPSLEWIPDGKSLAIVHIERPKGAALIEEGETDDAIGKLVVGIFDARSGRMLREFVLREDQMSHVQDDIRKRRIWSPDGRWLAYNRYKGVDDCLEIWNTLNGTLDHEIKKNTNEGSAFILVTFSPDGEWLVYSDSILKPHARWLAVHELKTAKTLFELRDPIRDNYATNLAWSPEGTWLGVLNDSRNHRLWNTAKPNEPRWEMTGPRNFVHNVSWAPDGQRVAAAHDDKSIRIWDASSGTLIRRMAEDTKSNAVIAVAWRNDGALLASLADGADPAIWDGNTGELIWKLPMEKGKGAQMQFGPWEPWSPTGTQLAIVDYDDKNVKIWDAATGKLLHELSPPSGISDLSNAVGIAWKPDDHYLALGREDGSIDIWDTQSGEASKNLVGHKESIYSLAWSPDGRRLASGSNDGDCRIWDAGTGRLSHVLEGHKGPVFSVAWSPDGLQLASGGFDERIRVWNTRDGTLGYEMKGQEIVTRLMWSPDGRWLASLNRGETDNTLTIWDGHTGKPHQLIKSPQLIPDMDWNPDSRRLSVAGWDGMLRLVDVVEKSVVSLQSGAEDAWLAVTEDGYFDGTVDGVDLSLVQGARVFSSDQAAPSRNRPDQVLKLLGAPPDEIEFYKELWLHRLKRLGLTPDQVLDDFSGAPQAHILESGAPNKHGRASVFVRLQDSVGLHGYQAFVNGVPLSPDLKRVAGKRKRVKLSVQLTAGVNHVEVTALNVRGVESLRASTTIEYTGDGLGKPRLFYLGLGISDYADKRIDDLAFAHQDALDLEQSFKNNNGPFASIHTKTFINEQVTDEALEKAGGFLSQIAEQDTLVVFIAGHGVRGQDKQRTYYFVDHDTQISDLAGTAIPFERIEALLFAAKARRKLFLLDTCQSGVDVDINALTKPLGGTKRLAARSLRGLELAQAGATPGTRQDTAMDPKLRIRAELWSAALRDRNRMILKDLSRRSGAIVLASSMGPESSLEDDTWRNGAFTEEILAALQSDVADTNGDGLVDTEELVIHVTAAVPRRTGDRQHPNVDQDNPYQRFAFGIGR